MTLRVLLFAGMSIGLTAGATPADDRLPIRLLFVGERDGDRTREFARFLESRFAEVRVSDRGRFDPADAAGADVVLLDWPQRGAGEMKSLRSPLGERRRWDNPTVLLGSAGLLLAACWQTQGSYG